jgi:hypothetical protein
MTESASIPAAESRTRPLRLLAELVVVAAAAVLIFAGFSKALDTESFALALAGQGLIPEPIVGQAASAVIVGEIVVGVAAVALLAAWGRLALAAGLLAGVAGAFGWYGLAMTVFPPPEPVGCGCGFSDAPADWPMIAARGAVAAVLLASISLATRRTPAPHSPR